MDQPAPDLGGTESFRRSAEVAGGAGEMLDVGGLGQRGEVADAHILDHALTKRGHDQLLCDEPRRMAQTHRLAVRWSDEGDDWRLALLVHIQYEGRRLNHMTTAKRFSPTPLMPHAEQ